MIEPVLLLSGSDPFASQGGHGALVRVHARAACRAGFEPHILSLNPDGGAVETELGVWHRVRWPWRRRGVQRRYRQQRAWWFLPRLVSGVEQLLRDHPRLRLVHGFGAWGCAAVRASRRLAREGIHVVSLVSAYTTQEHEVRAVLRAAGGARRVGVRLAAAVDLLAVRWILSRYEQETYTGVRRVLVNYESVRRLLTEAFGPDLPIRRVAYASETAFVHGEEKPPGPVPAAVAALEPRDAPLVVTVARHDPRKGIHVLLRALAQLRAAQVPFRACLVGGWSLLDDHRRLAADLGLGQETVLTGFVPDAFPYLQHADVFVLPSLQEGSGSLALLEALQAGAPVVASAVDGIPEDITDGEDGLLVPPGDSDALAEALARLLRDPELRTRLAGAGRATYKARFSAEAMTAALRDVYAEVGFVSRQAV